MKAGKNIIGPQVRRIRSEKGLSQPALAAECQRQGWDIGRDTIAKVEAGKRWVGDFELLYLARTLGVGLEALFPEETIRALGGQGRRTAKGTD